MWLLLETTNICEVGNLTFSIARPDYTNVSIISNGTAIRSTEMQADPLVISHIEHCQQGHVYIYILHRYTQIKLYSLWRIMIFAMFNYQEAIYIYIYIYMYIYVYIYIWCILVPTRGTVDLDHEVWDDAMELAALGRGLCLIWIVFTQIIQNNNCNSKRYQLTKWGFWTKITQFTEQRHMYINICIIIYI